MSDTESTSADTAPPVRLCLTLQDSEGQISDYENSGSSTLLSPTETNIASGDGGPPPLKIKWTSAVWNSFIVSENYPSKAICKLCKSKESNMGKAPTFIYPNELGLASDMLTVLSSFEEVTRALSKHSASISEVIPLLHGLCSIIRSLHAGEESEDESDQFMAGDDDQDATVGLGQDVAAESRERNTEETPATSSTSVLSFLQKKKSAIPMRTHLPSGDVGAYLADGDISLTDNPAKYWSGKLQCWPNLTHFALQHLSCPPTSVQSERVLGQLEMWSVHNVQT
ncbi:hypothetical protein E1301_Tti019433 [Triplophysa tibetana]|uniref:HAT C-terminal dimerisation domain-containing protein n=1 Tax=Triplophysa tibetana TaxID=1572043 RepID=A0A5A9PGM9_9TELE|nr:hypothetical protein E1301_Tti022823 [Triplophysa tibetana]KAA0721570.1 hypothetical protein E1301_Tti019433 [Triplophysa tibetana]